MKLFNKHKKDDIIEGQIVVPEEEEKEEVSELERKFEEKGKEIGRKAGKILHDSKVKAEELKGKIEEKEFTQKMKKKSSDLSSKVKNKMSKK